MPYIQILIFEHPGFRTWKSVRGKEEYKEDQKVIGQDNISLAITITRRNIED